MSGALAAVVDVGHGFTWSEVKRDGTVHVRADADPYGPTLCGLTLADGNKATGRTAPSSRRACPTCAQRAERLRDTPQQRAILRQRRTARAVRARFGAGTRVTSGLAAGTVERHVPGANAQGGYLLVRWDSGQEGRVSPCVVQPL